MKKIIFLAVTGIIAFSCNQKKQEYPKNADVLADNLKGNVEQTVTTDYKVDSTGKIGEQDSCCVVTVKYDKKGYITKYSSINKVGTDSDEEAFTHFDNGAMKGIKISKNGNLSLAFSIQIDKDGKYSGAEQYDSTNKMKFYFTNILQNDYGQITDMKKYNADSTFSGSMSNTYNNQINTGGEMKDSLGKVTSTTTLKLDDKNNVIESDTKSVVKDSTTNKVTKYKYDSFDDKGNWTQRTQSDENGKPEKITKREITYYKD
ncbi:MAG TPA: hypothetical protein VMU83_00735 [Hanamia sp.]|nr:hypothetical protein [Hanamia sp.]